MSDEILLNDYQYQVWHLLLSSPGELTVDEISLRSGLDQSKITATALEGAQQGYFEISEHKKYELILTAGASKILSVGLPERRACQRLHESGGSMSIAEFTDWADANSIAVNDVFKWGGARQWIVRQKTGAGVSVQLTEKGIVALKEGSELDERVLNIADVSGGRIFFDAFQDSDLASAYANSLLAKRPDIVKIKERTIRNVSLTKSGRALIQSNRLRVLRNALTSKDLESGAWREIKLRPYDVKLAAKDVYPAKIHPLRKIIEQTRRAFLEMGFAEVVSPMIESAFWNFDALFQPQDHPARDMQDTFYMRHPAETPLPGENSQAVSAGNQSGQDGPAMLDIVEQVRRTHEDGWETGSEGWGYKWSPDVSKQVVLRTHTTAATIRALAANPNPPGKFFCVGWTYRNETISFKHLPVFHQVDGIVIDEEANLASLMGTLQEFYSKMGFGRVKFKPAFYPYTEPSVDVVVYMESRGKWLEMGGAGIFRPEVTLPLGCTYPVLAWGLGIERLAMLRFGLSDIRELYRPSLDALEGVPLCR